MEIKNNTEISSFLAQDYLDAILERCQDGIYITDCEANTVFLNHSYELISGLAKSEMLGKNMRTLVENGVISASGTLSVLETGGSVTIEQRFRTGKRAVITSTPVFHENSDQMILVVTIVREITEIYSIRRELERLRQQNLQYAKELANLHRELDGDVELVASDAASLKLVHLAERVSVVDSPVLISGEAGTGKEKLARFIHNHSKRAAFSFMRINFSVVPKDEPLSYLFGCEDSENGEYRMGVLESADGGTVYVDEITEIPQIVRGRFLALLRRDACVMGDGMQRKLNIRWIVSSKYSLEELRERKLIEEDILSCLSLFPMEILPLRERRTDIIPLLDYFLRRYNQKTGEKKYFSRPCYDKLMRYEWPGNVREVSNLVQRAAIISAGDRITESDLALEETQTGNVGGDAAAVQNTFALKDGPVDLKLEVARLEAAYMTDAFLKFQNIRDAAKSLGMDSSTFVRKRQRYEKMRFMGKERKK